jgi:predicted unusual protein kinase regulating ubiquinone biosynthesis (AarF/ABC1/UbiB family)
MAMRSLISLVLRELFEFGVMQTDPNFSNYQYQPDVGRLVLLNFGASTPVAAATSTGYRQVLQASLSGDRNGAREAAQAAGFIGEAALARHGPRIDRMIDVVVGKDTGPRRV